MEDSLLVRWIDADTDKVFDITLEKEVPMLNQPIKSVLQGIEMKPLSVKELETTPLTYEVVAERRELTEGEDTL